MASGKSLELRWLLGPSEEYFWVSFNHGTYFNTKKDRTLAGKKRRRARRKA